MDFINNFTECYSKHVKTTEMRLKAKILFIFMISSVTFFPDTRYIGYGDKNLISSTKNTWHYWTETIATFTKDCHFQNFPLNIPKVSAIDRPIISFLQMVNIGNVI